MIKFILPISLKLFFQHFINKKFNFWSPHALTNETLLKAIAKNLRTHDQNLIALELAIPNLLLPVVEDLIVDSLLAIVVAHSVRGLVLEVLGLLHHQGHGVG